MRERLTSDAALFLAGFLLGCLAQLHDLTPFAR